MQPGPATDSLRRVARAAARRESQLDQPARTATPEARAQQGNSPVGNAKVTLPEELHDLVSGAVADLEPANHELGLDAPAGDMAGGREPLR